MEDLARLSIKNKPVYVGVDDAEQESTVEGLEQVTSSLSLVGDCPNKQLYHFGETSAVNSVYHHLE